jgi:hypothetical protein
MWAQMHQIGLLAADSPGPRGDNPSDLGGILIIVGIVVTVAVLGFVGALLLARVRRPRADVSRRKPHPPGRVGRTR